MAPSNIFNIIVSIVRSDLDSEIVHVTEEYREAARVHDSEPYPTIASIAKRGHTFHNLKQLHNEIKFRIEDEITKCVNLDLVPRNSIDREEVFWAVMDGQGKFDWEHAYTDSDDDSLDIQTEGLEPGANSPDIKIEESDEIAWPPQYQPPNETARPSQPQQPVPALGLVEYPPSNEIAGPSQPPQPPQPPQQPVPTATLTNVPRPFLRYPRGIPHDGWLLCPYPTCDWHARDTYNATPSLRLHIRSKHYMIRYPCGVPGCQAMFNENAARKLIRCVGMESKCRDRVQTRE